MSAEHKAAYADHKKCTEQLFIRWMEKDQKEAYKAAMEDVEDSSRLKLQSWIQCNTPHQTHKPPSWSSKRLTSETD